MIGCVIKLRTRNRMTDMDELEKFHRIESIDLLRVISIISVIVIHCVEYLVHHCINNRVKLYCQWYTLISPFKRICRNIILFDETQNTFFQLLYRLVTFPF